MLMTNDHGGGTCVAPHGGVEGRLSTNPIACAVPIERQNPIVLDMSTSVVASGKIRVKQHQGEALPHGWLIDAQGESTTNADDFYSTPPAALLPFGGTVSAHKGFGLSVIVDILSGALTGAGCSQSEDARVGNGLFVLVINVASFRGFPGFSAEIERFIGYLKSAKRAAGVDAIRMPGERGWEEQHRREQEGIPIDAETWAANSGTSIIAHLSLDENRCALSMLKLTVTKALCCGILIRSDWATKLFFSVRRYKSAWFPSGSTSSTCVPTLLFPFSPM